MKRILKALLVLSMLLLISCSSTVKNHWGSIDESTAITRVELNNLIDTSSVLTKDDSLVLSSFPSCEKTYKGKVILGKSFNAKGEEICIGTLLSEEPMSVWNQSKNITVEKTYLCGDSLYSTYDRQRLLDFRSIEVKDSIFVWKQCTKSLVSNTDISNIVLLATSDKDTLSRPVKLNGFDEFAKEFDVESVIIKDDNGSSFQFDSNFQQNMIESYRRKPFSGVVIEFPSLTNGFLKFGGSIIYSLITFGALEVYNIPSKEGYQVSKVLIVGSLAGILFGTLNAFSDDVETLKVINLKNHGLENRTSKIIE